MADATSGIEADPNKRLKELEAKVSDLETRIEVMERYMSARFP